MEIEDELLERCRAPRATTVSLQEGIVENLRAFQSQHKMKKAALHIIAGQLSEEKIKAAWHFMSCICFLQYH